MPKKLRLLLAGAFLLVIFYIIYSSTGLAKVSCEVCMEYKGRKSCRSAAATKRDDAETAARGMACSEIAGGRDESIACNTMTRAQSVVCK